MPIETLDHVNIIASDLQSSAQFYRDLFGLEIRNAPSPLTPDVALWLHDSAGRPILHINSQDCPRTYDRAANPGPTGAIHHVAFNCRDQADIVRRIEARGLAFQVNTVASIGLKQIFVKDPDDVLLELNFRDA